MTYHVYGLHLESSIEMPELRRCPRNSAADVTLVVTGEMPDGKSVPAGSRFLLSRHTNLGVDALVYHALASHIVRWETRCDFEISLDGRSLTCRPHAGAGGDLPFIRATLLNTMLPYALHLRGIFNLHASASVLPSGAAGFIAESGTGKSTTAAAFARAGYPALTEDILAVREIDGQVRAMPGFPSVTMTPESVAAFWEPAAESGPKKDFEKTRITLDGKWGTFHGQHAPLVALYLLGRGKAASPIMRRVDARTAVPSLLENTNSLLLMDEELLARTFKQAAWLAGRVPVFAVDYPSDLARLPELVQAVAANTASLSPAG